MKTNRLFALITLLVVCSLASFAQTKDPKIIIRGVTGGGVQAPTRCIGECTPVGLNFTFGVDHNGGRPLFFNNASGQDFTTLTLTETGVPAEEVSCVQNLYLNCTVTGQQNGSVQIVLSGIKSSRPGLNPRGGILAGANFSIGFNCVQRSCWPKGIDFTAQANGDFQTIDFPGAINTYAYGINNLGQVVGAYIDGNEHSHGFLYSDGSYLTIDYPDSTLSVAAGINNHGVIVGQYNDSDNVGHGFVYQDGAFSTVDIAGTGYQTYPTGIDDFGDLVGFCTDAQFNFHGCTSFDGPFQLFDYPGASASSASGVSFNGNRIAGGFGNESGSSFEHGFLYSDGEFGVIDFPGTTFTFAFGVNNNGEVVGTYSVPPSSANNGFSLISGTFTTINVPGALETNPSGRNDNGQVVGWFTDSDQVKHGYVMGN